MKRPQPDLENITTGKYISSVGSNRKLRRLWGTEIVDGVEVLHSRRHYHTAASRPANYETLFRFLDVYDDIKDFDGQGLKSAWFTLNKSKGPGEDNTVDPSFVVDNLNRMWWDDNDGPIPANLTLTTSVVISESFDTREGLSSINWNDTKENIKLYITNNFETLWSTNEVKQEGVGVINKGSFTDDVTKVVTPDEDDLSPDDPWLAILSRYALRDDGITCTVKDVEVGLGGGELAYNPGRIHSTAVVTVEIPYHLFTASDPIVVRILADLDTDNFPVTANMRWRNIFNRSFDTSVFSNEHTTQNEAKKVTFYETAEDLDPTTISRNYISWEDGRSQASIYEGFWLKSGDTYYFRAEVISDPKKYNTTQNELKAYLFSILDTGYKKKKVKWYKKVIAIVIFIVAVILAIPSGGASLTWAYAAAVAFAITMGALVLAVLAMLFTAIGMADWASAFAEANKSLAPLIAVASIILVVDGISAATPEISKAGASSVLESMASDFLTGITDVFTGDIATEFAISSSVKVLSAYTKVQNNKLESLSDKNKDLKMENAELTKEMQEQSDSLQGFMNIYAKPATADWSIFASTYDLPYEKGQGRQGLGCIQLTTKQAMRKSDYREPMFDSMIFV